MTPTPAPGLRADIVARLDAAATSRPERVLHSLDGTRTPVTPEELAAVGEDLWARVCAQLPTAKEADLLLGLDAGGIVPTLAVSMASRLPYRIAWKVRLDLAGAIRFTEPHANRPDVYAYGITEGQRIILVDDEVTTGRTMANLAAALRRAAAEPVAAACLVEDQRHGARAVLDSHALPLVSLHRLEASQ